MKSKVCASIALIMAVVLNPISAQATPKPIALVLDYGKPAAKSLLCNGVSIPITYTLMPAFSKNTLENLDIYDKGQFIQRIKLKTDGQGIVKMNSGQEWFGTTGGNNMKYAWSAYPINNDPQEACSQLKAEVDFAKSKFTAKKTLVVLFVLRSKA